MASERKTCSSSGTKYQVFLSFRGPDTRQGFTDVLYHALKDQGIHVFRDDEEIRKGEDIGDEILSAIHDSRIFVPIFSRNYASSKWCMIELAKMFESKEAFTSKKIMPVFYDVTVDDVKLKTELYKGALSTHRQTSVPAEIVENWEAVFREAGKIKGWELKNTGHAEFAKEFTRVVSIMLKVRNKSLDEHFIRRDDQEDELLKLLDVESCGVRIVGIHGMGGIGKTTLAKAVYNRLCDGFEHSSFLSDVRESSRQHKGIEHLQNKLLADLGFKSGEITDVCDGIGRIKELVATKKVLIVLDDIDHNEQIQSLAGDARWFGSGSRIVITSRVKSVLQTGGADGILEAKEMNPEEALRLFSMHAFDNDSPPADYHSVLEEAVASTGGLPLALGVIGSYLRNKKHEVWVMTIERLKKAPHLDVQKKLMISYEALDWRMKHIFLDIACFFIDHDKTNPTYMWDACGFDPDTGVEELINLSLIKIMTKKGIHGYIEERFWMHDQLRDLGRKIVDDENSKDAIKSRLWSSNDVSKALETLEDDEDQVRNIEMMRLDTLPAKVFSCFKKLRYLSCSGLHFSYYQRLHLPKLLCLSYDQRLHLPKLLWLTWGKPHDFTGTDLHFRNLVILNLSFTSISKTWGGWRHIQIGKQIKVLDLTSCKRLTKMPDLSKYSSLERLIFDGCSFLTDLDPSICKLEGLKFLDIRGCDSLKGFPEELCCLSSLEVILGDEWTTNKHLLKNHTGFNMPESFGNLISLSIFTMNYVKINKLPESIRMLVGLRRLSLPGCKGLQGLPDLLGDMVSLVELNLSFTDVGALPQSIGRLEKLQILDLSGSELKMLPDSIGHLRSLVTLKLAWSKIKEIPSTINLLPLLSFLDMHQTGITRLPPKLPTSLTKLYAGTFQYGTFQKLEWMEGMEGIGECHKLVDLTLPNMSSLSKSLSSLSQLQSLTLGCKDWQSSPPLPASLSFLHLQVFLETATLPQLSNLKNLSKLHMTGDSLEDDKIFGDTGVRELEALRELKFCRCKFRNLDVYFLPESLMILEISWCDSLETVKGVSHLKNLKKLKLELCHKLADIEELWDLDSLQSIYIYSCDSLETLPNLMELRNLREVRISSCKKFKGIDNIDELRSRTSVRIISCDCQDIR